MIQQINLYQEDSAGANPLFVNPYGLAVIAFLLLLLSISLLNANQIKAKQAEQVDLQNQIQQAKAHLQQLQAQFPSKRESSQLDQELTQTQNNYQNLSQILELLADNQSDRSQGYSRYMTALAEQADGNAWVTNISINTETNFISLNGSAYKPETIPLLLEHLQNTQAFKGRRFAKLLIQQSSDNNELFNFSVSSSLKSEKEEKSGG
jgi:Tfp pilus assembly protein PilN